MITIANLRDVLKSKKSKRAKYGNVKVMFNGCNFDSRKEATFYKDLLLREKIGEVEKIQVHPKYPLHINGVPVRISHFLTKKNGEKIERFRQVYIELDFTFVDRILDRERIVDIKGYDTDISRLKRAFFEAMTGKRVEVIKCLISS